MLKGRHKCKNNIMIKENHAEIEIISKKHSIQYILIDLDDINKVNIYNWYLDSKKYTYTCHNYKIMSLHRLIMNFPKEMLVDHINGNTLDNRKINLRYATRKQNAENIHKLRPDNTSGITGISWRKDINKFRATIHHNQKQIFLGHFNTIEEANEVIIEARKKYFTHSKECIIA